MAAYGGPVRARAAADGQSREISVAGVSASFFPQFTRGGCGVGNFSSGWDSGAGEAEVVLSERLAAKLFGGASRALGRTIALNNVQYRVVGVAPSEFLGLWEEADAWVSPQKMIALGDGLRFADSHAESGVPVEVISWKREPIFFALTASPRLLAKANSAALERIVQAPENRRFHLHFNRGLTKDPVRDAMLLNLARLTFLVAAMLIMAAGLNYAGLLLAQAPQQAEEVRLKRILGASAARLAMDAMLGPAFTVLASFLIGAGGTAVFLAILGRQALRTLPTGSISRLAVSRVSATELCSVCLFACAIALVPALRLLSEGGAPRLGYTSTGGKWAGFAIRAMVAAQMACCIVVCLLAWTMAQAVRGLSATKLGFDPNHLTAIEIGTATKDAVVSFSVGGGNDFPFADFARGVLAGAKQAAPAVHSIAASSCAPFGQPMRALTVLRLDRGAQQAASIHYCGVTQGYFQTMGNPIYRGRAFSADKFADAVAEAIVNRQAAREIWPGEDPLHKSVRIEDPNSTISFTAEIVGIADDMRFAGPTSSPEATIFLPLRENVFALSFPLYFLVQGSQSSVALSELIRQQAEASIPNMGVTATYRIDERLEASFLEWRARLFLPIAGAGMLALIAYLGMYAALMHTANSRRREIAVRLCFGASRWDIRRAMLAQALQCGVPALGLSLICWRVLFQLAARQWMGGALWSWTAAGAAPLAVLAIALGIALLPANAAAQTSPAHMLKEQ